MKQHNCNNSYIHMDKSYYSTQLNFTAILKVISLFEIAQKWERKNTIYRTSKNVAK